MKRVVLTVGAIVTCVSFLFAQEKSDVPEGWTKINICHISFYAPPDLKKSGMNGLDSCLAQYTNNDIALDLDYGRYGGPATARGSELEWKQESRSVGGKDAQLTTFVATYSNSGLKYIAALYVVVKPVERDRLWEWPTTLTMSVTADRRKDRDAALAIFRTIRLNDPPNNSLGVFR